MNTTQQNTKPYARNILRRHLQ